MQKTFILLNLFIFSTLSWAEASSPSKSQGFLMNLPVIIAFIALFYFAFIRPQKQQQKKHDAFVNSLKLGDEVVTSSGILGTIRGLTDKIVTLEVSEATEVKFLRSQIQTKLQDQLSSAKA